jgi:hypothetical protein
MSWGVRVQPVALSLADQEAELLVVLQMLKQNWKQNGNKQLNMYRSRG